jgi:hypothetical protein
LKNGNYEIGVHIADVAHYVEEDTVLDKTTMEKQPLLIYQTGVNQCSRNIFQM